MTLLDYGHSDKPSTNHQACQFSMRHGSFPPSPSAHALPPFTDTGRRADKVPNLVAYSVLHGPKQNETGQNAQASARLLDNNRAVDFYNNSNSFSKI